MANTVAQLGQMVLNRLSIVPGLSQQTYASPRITQAIEDAIVFCMDETRWITYVKTVTVPVVNGLLTGSLVGARGLFVDNTADIVAIFAGDGRRKLSQWNLLANPNNVGGVGRIFFQPDNDVAHRPFIIIPPTYTDNVTVVTYVRPLIPLSDADVIHLDATMVSLGATYFVAAGDSISSGDTSRLQSMFHARMRQCVKSNEEQSFALDPTTDGGTDIWWTPP